MSSHNPGFSIPFPNVFLSRRQNASSSSQSSSTSDKPASPALLTVTDVHRWLHSIGFAQYAEAFLSNEINGTVMRTLTSEELRDDLGVANLRHRRDLLDAIRLLSADTPTERLPEHGRILDHLSNVRTYHSWIRVGVQFLGFAIVTLRLSPNFRETALVSAASFYYALVGVLALLYGVFRYKRVIDMIEASGPSSHRYRPDRVGVLSMLVLVLVASVLSFVLIGVRSS